MKAILITGAMGLLGSRLVPYLKERGLEIVTHARVTHADVRFDLSDFAESFKLLNQIKPYMIINLVAMTNVDRCQEEYNKAFLVNTRAVENLVHWIMVSGADCHLVQISTDQVYDGPGPHIEDAVTLTNNYAFSKYASELAAVRVSSTILRTNFVGRSLLSHRESLTDWVYNSLKTGKNVQALNDVFFSPLSIAKLIEMIFLVLEKKPVGIYNLGSNNGFSKADFIFAFAHRLNLPTNTLTRIEASEASFLKVYRPKDMRMDNSKFENVLGVKLPNLTDLIENLTEEYYAPT